MADQTITKKQFVKFAHKGDLSFYDYVKKQVDEYFISNKIYERGNWSMYFKTVVMLSLYFVPYLLIVTGNASSSLYLFYGLWMIMGLGIVGIGTSIMHDSNHGSYSANTQLNYFFGGLLNIIGGYSRNWRIQHNILHHTYTNLNGLDEDIDAGILIRMCPQKKYYKFHKYQYLYAWFLYGIMNLFWISVKDYRMILRYHKNGLLRKEKVTKNRALLELSLYKLVYVAYVIVLPLLFSKMPWYHVVGGFVLMHLLAGLGLACIFQPAHVMESSEFPVPDEKGKIENSWAVHQLLNTTDFAPKNKVVTWFIGGLNYQIEHHLFPHICHVHYPQISVIVQSAAERFGLPYNVQPTFRRALYMHAMMLKSLGRNDEAA